MAFFDLTKLFFTFSIFWLVVEPGDDRQSVRMRGVQCNASEKFIYRNYSCYAKSYSRNISTTNIIATAKMPLNNLRANFRLFYKYGTIYRQVLNYSNIDVCALVEEETNNILLWQLQALAKDNAPGLIHSCPYYEINLRNGTDKMGKMVSIWASGDYKYIVNLFEGNETVATVNVIISILSPDKHSFG